MYFDRVGMNKNRLHGFKQPIDLNLVDVHKMVAVLKIKSNDEKLKYFVGYGENDVFRPLCIKLSQMSGFIMYFDNGGKNMSFMVKGDNALANYSEIWNKIKELTGRKLITNLFMIANT